MSIAAFCHSEFTIPKPVRPGHPGEEYSFWRVSESILFSILFPEPVEGFVILNLFQDLPPPF